MENFNKRIFMQDGHLTALPDGPKARPKASFHSLNIRLPRARSIKV
jgi:hypothetical protein